MCDQKSIYALNASDNIEHVVFFFSFSVLMHSTVTIDDFPFVMYRCLGPISGWLDWVGMEICVSTDSMSTIGLDF